METPLFISTNLPIEFKHIKYYNNLNKLNENICTFLQKQPYIPLQYYYNDSTVEMFKTKSINPYLYQNFIIRSIKGNEALHKKYIRLRGVGYSFNFYKLYNKDIINTINVKIGKTHDCPISFGLKTYISIRKKKRKPKLRLMDTNKQQLGHYLYLTRRIKKADPYRGKGLRYRFEKINWKEGKKTK